MLQIEEKEADSSKTRKPFLHEMHIKYLFSSNQGGSSCQNICLPAST